MTRRIILAAALTVVMGSGCTALGPEVDPPPLGMSSTQPQEPSRPAVPTHIEALTLEQAQELAEGLNPQLAAARARVEEARGQALQAGLFPNPSLVTRMESAPIEGRTTADAEYVAGISQPLPIGGRVAAAKRVEELRVEFASKEYEVRRMEVRRRVHGAFATTLYMQEVVKVRTEAVRNNDSAVAIAKARLDAGDAIPEEVARAELDQVRTRLQLTKARSLHSQARFTVVTAMGQPDLKLESVEGVLGQVLELPTLESLQSRLAKNPLIARAKADMALQAAGIELAEAQRIPDVNLDLFYRRLGDSNRNALDLGISIPLPLFDRNQGKLNAARAAADVAEARARSTKAELLLELRVAHSQLTQALAHARTLREEVLPRAKTVLEAAEARYAGGDESLADLLPQRRDWIAVQLARLAALRSVMQAWTTLLPLLRRH